MKTKQLNAAMTVQGFAGASLGNGKAMSDRDGEKFIDRIASALKKLEKLGTGREIVQEIVSSGKQCVIFSGDLANSGSASPLNQGLQSQIDATIVYFVPRHKVQTTKQAGVHAGGVNPKLKASMGDALEKIGAPTKKAQTAPEFQAVITRARNKFGTDTMAFMGRLTGNSTQDIMDMAVGTKAMDRETFIKICYNFYDFLTPGPGVSAAVRFRAEPDIPDHVLLGHELIHAWRLIKGRRIVMAGSMYDEEMMTVGLGPFATWKFTENQLRREAGLAARAKYGKIDTSSLYVQSMMLQIEA
jgi:hypothetical protein